MAEGTAGRVKQTIVLEKLMEIGSIYEIDPELLNNVPQEAAGRLCLEEINKYNKKNIRFTSSGREAVALALESLERKNPDVAKRCLLPAYMCDTVFFPFERAGWDMYFYHLDRKLQADTKELKDLIERVRPGLVFIHPYYGVDTWKSVRSFFHEWRKKGICVVEDVTQSYYLEQGGCGADYVVGSLRKWYAVPDGGFVACDEALGEFPECGADSNEMFLKVRREMLTEKWEYLHGQGSTDKKRTLKEGYLKKNREMEAWLDGYAGISVISDDSAYILTTTDEKECRKRRQDNCKYLHGRMAGRQQVTPVFGDEFVWQDFQGEDVWGSLQGVCGQAAAPLYYPVYVEDRDEMQRFLSLNGVYAPTLWPVGRENAAHISENEQYIYGHILALPIDQRYGTEEMRRVVEVIDQYERLKAIAAEPGGRVVAVRVDANDTVATGHVMRCITIAEQLMRIGCKVLFFTADEGAGELIKGMGMEYVCLHTRWDHMVEETALLRAGLKAAGCGKMLVDSYQATAEYFEGLRDCCKLAYIDDCFEDVYPVDMVINYNAYHVRFPYEEAYAGKAKLLLGTAYVPLREEFYGGAENGADSLCGDNGAKKGVDGLQDDDAAESDKGVIYSHVLLSSGGGDLCNALPGILSKAVQDDALRHVVFHTVVGGFNRNTEELECMAAQYPNIRLHRHVDHMAQLMGQCRAAVSAAGTMLFELSAMRVPSVFFVSADNQQYDSEFFAQEERMLFAGDIRKGRDACLDRICRQLKLILDHEDMRERMRDKLHEVTDGRGARRIAEKIARL